MVVFLGLESGAESTALLPPSELGIPPCHIRIASAFIQKHKVTCLESRYKAVPVFSLLRHIRDAPVHWHEETSSCGDFLPVEESARQYQYWQANSTFQWSPDMWYPAVFPEAKGCADDLHRTILASFHGDSFEFRSCPFRSDASANDISKTIYRTGIYRKALCQFPYADALIVSFQNQLSSFVVQHSTHILWLCYITFSQKLKYSLLYYWKLLYKESWRNILF